MGSAFRHLLLAASSASCGGYGYHWVRTELQVGQTVGNCTAGGTDQEARSGLCLRESSHEPTAGDRVVIETRCHGAGCNTRTPGDGSGGCADRQRNHAKRNAEFEMAIHRTITQIDTIPSSSLPPWGVLSRMLFPAYLASYCNISVTNFNSYTYKYFTGDKNLRQDRGRPTKSNRLWKTRPQKRRVLQLQEAGAP